MKPRARAGSFVLLMLGYAALAAPVNAAPPSQPNRRAIIDAQAAMERGVQLAERGDYEGALLQYATAEGLVPDANLPFRYAGEALEKLERYKDATVAYERYLAVRANVTDRDVIRERIDRITRRHLEGTVEVRTAPPGADARIDDEVEPRGATPIKALQLPAGHHVVRLRREGYVEARIELDIQGGQAVLVEQSLLPSAVVTVPPPAVRGDSTRTWGLVSLGAGVTVLAASFGADWLVLGDAHRDFDRARASGGGAAYDEQRRVDTTQAIVLGAYAAGATATILGAVLLLWPRTPHQRKLRPVPVGTGGLEILF